MQQFFENLFAGFGITDLVDILIVAFLIYSVLEFIRESRAEQLIRGILVVLLIALVAQMLHLYTLNWIIKAFLEVGLLALVILFQPELRRGLDRLGGRLIRPSNLSWDVDRARKTAGIIADAVAQMSNLKTGALIVFEQKSSLKELCETGTMLDAKISETAIESIFYKGTPLHDGALLVRGDRLLAAGVVLPLTERADIPQNLGTRHRAALGVSEVSDAAVLVVSEETGMISWAQDGELERPLSRVDVERRLTDLFLGKTVGKEGEDA